jgi:hypothetical protein
MKSTKNSVHHFGNKDIVSEWGDLGRIREIITLSVSSRGNGLCMYLPKDFCEVYGIVSGDRIKIEFREHFKKRRQEQG